LGLAALSAAPPNDLVGDWFRQRGSLLAFLLIFLMGLALNLTPCVYPMMGVTISLFGAGRRGREALAARARVRAGPSRSMYSSLGVVAALTGGLFRPAAVEPVGARGHRPPPARHVA